MTPKVTGWIIGIAAMGMMCTLLAGDISSLNSWSDVMYPSFVAGVLTHIGTVVGAFIGGNLIPNMFASSENKISQEKLNQLNKQ